MRVILIVILICVKIIVNGQNIDYKYLLFDKPLNKNSHFTDKVLHNLPGLLFFKQNIESINIYYTIKTNDEAYIRVKEQGSILELKYSSEKDLLETKSKIDSFAIKNYNGLSDVFNYRKYSEFIDTGLIVVFEYSTNKIFIIRVDSCVFEDQKKHILQYFKMKDFKTVFVFNCGGEKLVDRW